MSREIDRRNFTVNKLTPVREAELQSRARAVSDRLTGAHRIRLERFDTTTGNPTVIVSESAPAETGNYVQRALEHVHNISRALGFEATQPVEFVADPHEQHTTSGAVAVHLQQQYKGITVFQAAETVRFAPDGALKETVGNRISVAQDMSVTPQLTVQEAVQKAAEHVAVPQPDEQGVTDPFGEPVPLASVSLSGFHPTILATFPNKPEQPTVLEAGPFGENIKANLLWFPLTDSLRLTWEVIMTLPNAAGQYRTLVDAETGEILYCYQLMRSIAARGNVYRVDGTGARQMTNFPRVLADYELPIPTNLPAGFPDDWVTQDRTLGNATNAHLGATGSTIQGTLQGGVLTFDPTDATGDEQKVLNIFYYNCCMHDFFYLLGFREAEGNFQHENLGRGGTASDRVDARAHSGAVWGTANMATPVDGLSPVMNMGLVTSTNRHTAFDSTVVFHEFMHGVTNRLVGGPMNDHALEAEQSGGMGEGWGDYLACTINNATVVGAWVVNHASGIRGFPYDSDFPDTFADLGTGRYDEVHNIGEIWCAALLEMNRKIGANLSMQLVVDALKLSPANPSFLDMRDALLSALDNKLAGGQLSASEHTAALKSIWSVLAHFGMGPKARSNGASLTGIVADFQPPSDQPSGPRVQLETSPQRTIPDNQAEGVTSTLTVAQAGRITRIALSVDIQHPYIGDLHVSLLSPAGKTAVLHNRTGASADDIARTYSSDDTPDLGGLIGDQVQGNWTLQVADFAPADVGTLRHWRLDVSLETPATMINIEAAPGLVIPDNNPTGVSHALTVADLGTTQNIRVGVDITHTYLGDLRVELVTPAGVRAVLHNRTGGSQDNLIVTYDAASTAALVPLVGQPIQGHWVLRVTDLAGRDVGKLNKWSLELTVS